MPSLSTCNHFEVLLNIHDSKTTSLDVQKSEDIPVPVLNSDLMSTSVLTPRVQKLKWEKTLPKKLIAANIEGISTSLKLKVEIETTDTAEKNLLWLS